MHAADTSYFVVQMHVNVPGAPAVLDANSADNDASLGVVPPLPPSGGGGQIPTLTFEAIAPEVVFNALLDLCNVQVGSEGLVRANLGPEKSRWVIRYPNGTTTDETTPYLPSWFLNGFPVGTTRITVTATAQSGPSPAPVSFSVIVRDKQAPTFLATGSVVANATSHRGRESPTPIPKHSTLRRRPRQGQPEPRNRLSDQHHSCDGDG